MLAALFLAAVWLEASHPGPLPIATYVLLAGYVLFAAALVFISWSNWWLDAYWAGPAHAVDISLFTLLVLLTEGYTSPFFPFFMFLLLSAAIRWGWRATGLTAVLVTLLYLIIGLLVAVSSADFDLQRFVVRTGNLLILSLILIWFGANQWRRNAQRTGDAARGLYEQEPLEAVLEEARSATGASNAIMLWRPDGEEGLGLIWRQDMLHKTPYLASRPKNPGASGPFLYNVRSNHALCRDGDGNLHESSAAELIATEALTSLELTEGLAIPLVSDLGAGALFLEGVPGLSTDHIDLGERLAAAILTRFQAHARIQTVEESAEARSRVSLARDLHDSVVQFLAGAAFRLEALKRSTATGRDPLPELDELKRLMLQQQGELRSFITALRTGPTVTFGELAAELRQIAERLSRQWNIGCSFHSSSADITIPARLQLDIQQLVREGVANAVRHANAKSIEIELSASSRGVALQLINDGDAPYPLPQDRSAAPRSLQERVELAGGSLQLDRGMGVTKLSVLLPLGDRSP
ncbi:MAG TPA: histidine kinase [Sphingomicrobium sp.]|nr:histidine kinase [Sphingomicrobium sp.]